MKKILLIIFTLLSFNSINAQSLDSTKTSKVVIGIPTLTSSEYKQFSEFISTSSTVKSAYFCSKHKVIIFDMIFSLEKDELIMLFGGVVESEKLYFKDTSKFDEIIKNCSGSDNIKIK